MIKIDSGYKIKDCVDLTVLVDYGFDPSSEFHEYYRCYKDDEYLWVDKYTRIIDMTSPNMFCDFRNSKRVINKLIKAELVEQINGNNMVTKKGDFRV